MKTANAETKKPKVKRIVKKKSGLVPKYNIDDFFNFSRYRQDIKPKFKPSVAPDIYAELAKKYDLLFKMYYTFSPSRHEYGIQSIVIQELNRLGISFNMDIKGNIYSFKPDKPIFSAHMDMVPFDQLLNINIDTDFNVYGNTSLGADDKNGVYIVLRLLAEFPELSFCFSVNEESGGGLWQLDNELPFDISYCLVFDRKGNSDILGAVNGYCSPEFSNSVYAATKAFGYKPATGTWSDADFFKMYTDAVNLSCGYYLAHTENEYSNLLDIENVILAAKAILEKV